MGRALKVITGRVTNPSTTFTALTANTGDSFTVPNFDFSRKGVLEEMWTQAATAGFFRVRSPRMHDFVAGLKVISPASQIDYLLAPNLTQSIYPSDPLTVEMTGGAAETDLAAMLWYFEDLPGIDARLAMWEEISGRIKNLVGIEHDVAVGGTAGQYSGSRAINADDSRFKANTDYALLGYQTDLACGVIGFTGPDTGNTRVGGPGPVSFPADTGDWFVKLGIRHGTPHIPIINSNNAGSTNIDIATTAVAGTAHITSIWGELLPLGG